MPAALCLCLLLLCPQKDAERLQQAEKLLRSGAEPSVRQGAELCLQINSAAAMELLLQVLRGDQPHFRDIVWETLPRFTDPYARQLVETELKQQKKDAELRQWCAEALGRFGDPTPGPALEKALGDSSLEVRRAAARALGLVKFAPAAKALHKAAADKDPELRANAIEALARIGDADGPALLAQGLRDADPGVRTALLAVVPQLLPQQAEAAAREGLQDEDWHVRVQALENLGALASLDTVDALIPAVADPRPAVARRAIVILRALTGARWNTSAEWEAWWKEHRDAAVAGASAAASASASASAHAEAEADSTVATYNGIQVYSDHVAFLIDCSSDMDAVSETKGRPKSELARAELAQTLERLPGSVKFNVYAYSSEVEAWQKEPAAVNARNTRAALAFLDKVPPRGSKNIWLALTTAAADPEIDTVFLLSSGEPEVGEYVHYNRVVEHLLDLNRFRKLVVHTVVYSDEKWYQDQLIKISEATGGKFIAVP